MDIVLVIIAALLMTKELVEKTSNSLSSLILKIFPFFLVGCFCCKDK